MLLENMFFCNWKCLTIRSYVNSEVVEDSGAVLGWVVRVA